MCVGWGEVAGIWMCVSRGGENMRVYEPLFTCTCVSMATNKYVYRHSLKIIKWSIFNNDNKEYM